MKYLISVGHTSSGNTGCGAVGYLNESDCTRQIAPLVVSKLQSLGYTAIKLQIDGSNKYDYVDRTNQANSIGGDMFVEIHLNAGGGTGCEVLTTSGSKASSYATKVSQCISNKLSIANRGHKTTSGLYVLNNTSMPAMLVECCFVDNKTDYNAYNADKIASAIVEGLTGQSVQSTKYKIGWNENSTGWWYSYDGTSYYSDCWKEINGDWYSFDPQGYARCNCWLYDKGYWYWLKDSCKMAKNEWIRVGDCFYYFGDGGGMYSNCYTPDGYWVDKDGVWDTTKPRK